MQLSSDHDSGQPFCPPGPKTLLEVVNFPELVLPPLLDHVRSCTHADPLQSLHNLTIIVTTTYSGVGSAEWAMGMIVEALKERGCEVDVFYYSACELSPTCRTLLKHHLYPPQFLFGNLLYRLPETTLSILQEMQTGYRERLPTDGPKKDRTKAAKELSNAFFEKACEVLDTAAQEMTEPLSNFCEMSGGMAPLKPMLTPDSLWIEIGGNTCTPWSTSGDLLGWLDPASLAALAWGWWVRIARPDIVINECVPQWPAEQFWKRVLGPEVDFSMETLMMNPIDMGIPSNRPRSYSVVNLGLSVEKAPLKEGLRKFANKSMMIDGSVYFQANEDVALETKKAMLRGRHITLDDDQLRGLPWSIVLGAGNRGRLKEYREAEEGQVADTAHGRARFVLVSQSKKYAGSSRSCVPTLVRNSIVYDLKRGRLLLPYEHFLANGMPVFVEGLPYQVKVLQDRNITSLSLHEARQISGNMMHLSSVGSVLLLVLCCFEHGFERPVGL